MGLWVSTLNKAETATGGGRGATWCTVAATVPSSFQWRREPAALTSLLLQWRTRRDEKAPADTGCIFRSRQADTGQSRASALSAPVCATGWAFVIVLLCPTVNTTAAISILFTTTQSPIASRAARQVPLTTLDFLPQGAHSHLGIASESSPVQGESQFKEHFSESECLHRL